jgi:hypothetical protein
MMLSAVKTPITPLDVARALRAAWLKLFEVIPADQCIAVLMAQSALETGRWKSCWNYNLGNIKGGGKWTGDTCQFRCNEVIKGKVEWFDPPHPQTTFRAYSTLTDAAADYLWLLRRRFFASWEPILRGDPIAFSQALKAQNYYTAPEPPYTKAVKSLYSEYMRLLNTHESDAPPAPDDVPDTERAGHGLEALALSVAARSAADGILDDARREMTEHDADPTELGGSDAED